VEMFDFKSDELSHFLFYPNSFQLTALCLQLQLVSPV